MFHSPPLVTVVIPVYNSEAYITCAIDSVLKQSDPNWQLILIDDASTDHSTQLISPYLSDPRIRFKALSENRGVGHAIQTALSLIETPYFIVLDYDDWLDRQALDTLVQEMEKQPATTSIVSANRVIWEDTGNGLQMSRVRKFRAFTDKYEFMLYPYMPSPRLMRTETVRAVGGIPLDIPYGGRYGEDRCLLLNLIAVSNFHWIDRDLYHARLHQSNTTGRNNQTKFGEVRKYMVEKVLELWGDEYEPIYHEDVWLNVKELVSTDGQYRRLTLTTEYSAINRLPYVSVVIPTYNRASLIHRALESALAQTFKNHEIIVVDDGSTDETEQVVRSYPDPRIRYFKQQKNKGMMAAVKKGIRKSRGKYIALLDSDDEWLPKKLEKQVRFIESLADREHCVTYTQLIQDDGSERKLRPLRGKRADEPLEDYFFTHWGLMQSSTLMIPRQLYSKLDPLPNPKRHTDWDTCLRMDRLNAKFHFLEEPLTIWYADKRPDRTSNAQKPMISLEWILGYRKQISQTAYESFIKHLVSPYMPRQTIKEKEKAYKKELLKSKPG